MKLELIILPILGTGLETEGWVCLLVYIEPKDTTKPKNRRRKDLFFAKKVFIPCCKENTRDLSQSSVSPTAKLGKI